MKLLISTLLLFVYSLTVSGQDDKIERTDSSVITTEYFEYLNSIRVFNELKHSRKIHYQDLYFTTKKIKEQGTFQNGDAVGLWKYYSPDGKIEKEINYTSGLKKYYTNTRDAYDDLFSQAQAKANLIVLAHFEKSFVRRYIRWNPSNSYYYGLDYQSGRWFEVPDFKPSQFLFRYDIILDKDHKYSCIEFTLDSQGRILKDHDILGLTPKNKTHNSLITQEQAVKIGRANGLTLRGKNIIFYLKWVKSRNKNTIEGDYEMIIAEYKKKTIMSNQTTFYYDAIAVSPWTGKFIAKRRLRRSTAVHTYSSSSTGFIEY